MADYYILITDAGAALEAAAQSSGGTPVNLTQFAVGDGNGAAVTPVSTQTTLVHETFRGNISSLTISPDQGNVLLAECIIPAESGGYTIREIGIYTTDGTLYAVGNYAEQVKPAPDSGFAASLQILAELAVSSTSDIHLIFSGSSYLTEAQANTLYLRQDKNLSEIAASGTGAQQAARDNLGVGTAATHDDDEYVKSVNGHLPEEGAITLTSADVDALSIDGGEVTGTIIIKHDDAGLILQPTNEDDANYVLFRNADGSDRAFIGSGSNGYNNITLSSYVGGNDITLLEDGSITLVPATGKPISANGQIDVPIIGSGSFSAQNGSGAPIYQYIDSAQTSQYIAIFKQYYVQGNSTWSGGTIVSDNNFLIHHTDGTGVSLFFRFGKDGTFTPGTYSNFDARYDARYVKSTQLGTQGWFDVGSGTTEAPAGCVLTGGGDFGSDNGSYYYRPDQYIINGVPYTAAYTSTLQSLPTDSVNVMSMPPISHINELINCQPYNNIFLSEVEGEIGGDKALISLRGDGGLDFYIARFLLTGSVFIVYENDSGLIRQIDTTPLNMWPIGMSIRGLASLPEGCNTEGGTWVYDAETDTVSQSPELVASWNRSGPYGKRLRAATGAFMLLQLLPSEDAAEKTAALKEYLTELQAVDLTQPDPIWPEWPEILS